MFPFQSIKSIQLYPSVSQVIRIWWILRMDQVQLLDTAGYSWMPRGSQRIPERWCLWGPPELGPMDTDGAQCALLCPCAGRADSVKHGCEMFHFTSVLKSGCITTRPRLKTLGRIEMNSADILLVCFHAECRKEEHASSSISRLQLTAVQPPTWVCMCKNEIAKHVYQLIGNFISKPVSKSVLLSVASIKLPWHGSEF